MRNMKLFFERLISLTNTVCIWLLGVTGGTYCESCWLYQIWLSVIQTSYQGVGFHYKSFNQRGFHFFIIEIFMSIIRILVEPWESQRYHSHSVVTDIKINYYLTLGLTITPFIQSNSTIIPHVSNSRSHVVQWLYTALYTGEYIT